MATRDLPPLPAIRVFDAAARHGSFTAAADERGMTQAAVSYQIKVLEERVGTAVFERHARGVGLTPVGRRLFHRVSAALDILSDAYADARGTQEATLTISAIPTFATNFLAQRLGEFQCDNANLAVRLEISEALTDFSRDNVDVAIRGGRGTWEGLISHLLLPTVFTPMLSSALANSIGGVSKPEDLMRLPILSQGDLQWQRWLAHFGLTGTAHPQAAVHSLQSQVVDAASAMSGHGVAMLTPAFFQNELARGQLIQPFDHLGDDGSGYWLVYPESRRNAHKIKRFRSWLDKATRMFRDG